MDFKIYPLKRGKIYRLYVQFVAPSGERKRLSTGVTYPLRAGKKVRAQGLKLAEKAALDKILEITHAPAVRKSQRIATLSHFLTEQFYPHLQLHRAPSTLVSYRNALSHFTRICGDRPVDEYERSELLGYKLQRYNNENIRKATINIELRSIKAAFSWAFKNEFIPRNPYKGQSMLFKVQSTRRNFSKPEIERLFTSSIGTMIGLVVQLAYYTGMRIGELSELTWAMVDMEKKFIHLPARITKSNKVRMIPLGDKAFRLINILLLQLHQKRKQSPKQYIDSPLVECFVLQKEVGHGQYCRRSIQDQFREAMKSAGLPKELKFHCLRHSFATHSLEAGASIHAVSKIMGHSTPMVTSQFYDHTTALNYRDTVNLI